MSTAKLSNLKIAKDIAAKAIASQATAFELQNLYKLIAILEREEIKKLSAEPSRNHPVEDFEKALA